MTLRVGPNCQTPDQNPDEPRPPLVPDLHFINSPNDLSGLLERLVQSIGRLRDIVGGIGQPGRRPPAELADHGLFTSRVNLPFRRAVFGGKIVVRPHTWASSRGLLRDGHPMGVVSFSRPIRHRDAKWWVDADVHGLRVTEDGHVMVTVSFPNPFWRWVIWGINRIEQGSWTGLRPQREHFYEIDATKDLSKMLFGKPLKRLPPTVREIIAQLPDQTATNERPLDLLRRYADLARARYRIGANVSQNLEPYFGAPVFAYQSGTLLKGTGLDPNRMIHAELEGGLLIASGLGFAGIHVDLSSQPTPNGWQLLINRAGIDQISYHPSPPFDGSPLTGAMNPRVENTRIEVVQGEPHEFTLPRIDGALAWDQVSLASGDLSLPAGRVSFHFDSNDRAAKVSLSSERLEIDSANLIVGPADLQMDQATVSQLSAWFETGCTEGPSYEVRGSPSILNGLLKLLRIEGTFDGASCSEVIARSAGSVHEAELNGCQIAAGHVKYSGRLLMNLAVQGHADLKIRPDPNSVRISANLSGNYDGRFRGYPHGVRADMHGTVSGNNLDLLYDVEGTHFTARYPLRLTLGGIVSKEGREFRVTEGNLLDRSFFISRDRRRAGADLDLVFRGTLPLNRWFSNHRVEMVTRAGADRLFYVTADARGPMVLLPELDPGGNAEATLYNEEIGR